MTATNLLAEVGKMPIPGARAVSQPFDNPSIAGCQRLGPSSTGDPVGQRLQCIRHGIPSAARQPVKIY
jgi:hypothetical protein